MGGTLSRIHWYPAYHHPVCISTLPSGEQVTMQHSVPVSLPSVAGSTHGGWRIVQAEKIEIRQKTIKEGLGRRGFMIDSWPKGFFDGMSLVCKNNILLVLFLDKHRLVYTIYYFVKTKTSCFLDRMFFVLVLFHRRTPLCSVCKLFKVIKFIKHEYFRYFMNFSVSGQKLFNF